MFNRKKWFVLRRLAITVTTMAANGGVKPHTRHCASFRHARLMGNDPPSKRILLGVLRGCTALKALICSGDDASP